MTALRAVVMAFSMYSRIPMPEVRWEEKNRAWALCAFPLVGAAVGAVLWLWAAFAAWLGLGAALRAAGSTLIPLALTGGIHMDGFCDTVDALASHRDRTRRLEILSDPHIGSFAAMACGGYLLLTFALWCQFEMDRGDLLALCLLPVLSRALSAHAALTQPNARGGGLLAAFTQGRSCWHIWTVILISFTVTFAVGLCGLGVFCALPALFVYLWYVRMARREFGGLTGDLAGWFLQVCELAGLAGLVLAQRVAEVLV